MTWYDCTSCGACCVNPPANAAEGFTLYVEIDEPKSKLLRDPGLRKKHVVEDEDGVPHLRLDPSGRCTALVGRLGVSCRCKVYAHRPRGCRRVDVGGDECKAARRAIGLDPPLTGTSFGR